MKKLKFNFLTLLVSVLSISQLYAQSTDASISGRVLDNRGESLPGVIVSIRNESTGFQSSTSTNNDGRYFFKQLPLGKPYSVKTSFIGFGVQIKNDLSLNLGDQLVVNFRLTESSTGLDEVVITTNAINSRIDRLGSSTAITAQNIQQIPAQNRSL